MPNSPVSQSERRAVPDRCRYHSLGETCIICVHPEFCPYFGRSAAPPKPVGADAGDVTPRGRSGG